MGKAKGVVENRWYIPYDDVLSGESISSTLPPKTTNSRDERDVPAILTVCDLSNCWYGAFGTGPFELVLFD